MVHLAVDIVVVALVLALFTGHWAADQHPGSWWCGGASPLGVLLALVVLGPVVAVLVAVLAGHHNLHTIGRLVSVVAYRLAGGPRGRLGGD